MSIHRCSNYTFEYYDRQHDETHLFPLPFNTEEDPQHVYLSENGLKAVLGFLVRDESPADPFEEYDEGEFYQFDSSRKHDTHRPDLEDFKRIVRANPGRVFTHSGTGDVHGPGTTQCKIIAGPFTVSDTKSSRKPGKPSDCVLEYALDQADGYYIAPEDVTNPAEYAAGSIETYSQWCNGDVYGVVVWTYTRDSIADPWTEDPEREECWGYYGSDGYTAEELISQFRYAIAGNDPSQEATNAC